MALTRRIQVFISEEASEALDKIVSRGSTQTEAVERGLILLSNLPATRELSDTEQRLLDANVNPASAYELGRADGMKLASQPASSLDGRRPVRPDSRKPVDAADVTLEPASGENLVATVINGKITCLHPAKARRGKKCLECGEIV